MRREPRTATAEALTQAWQAGKEETATPWRRYPGRTLTPLYGGGVKAGVVDQELPVRASAIRGQLRTWWRLLQPRTASELLFAAESQLWGGISSEGPTASQVRLRVRKAGPVTLTPAFRYDRKPDGTLSTPPKAEAGMSAYALFPAQGKRHETNHRLLEQKPAELAMPGIGFELEIACPEAHWPEVERALRWWATFGGLGARTRRGLGAVELEDLAPVTREEVHDAGGRLVLCRALDSAVEAWQVAVDRLREFRQGEGNGRNPGKAANRPGRSRWPEPDMIRRLTDQWESPDHEPVHEVERLYPRAALGLPIVFHFKGPQKPNFDLPPKRRRDPEQVILEPQDDRHDRMASPLVLRPYRAGGGRYHPAALLIPGWEQALTVRGIGAKTRAGYGVMAVDEAARQKQQAARDAAARQAEAERQAQAAAHAQAAEDERRNKLPLHQRLLEDLDAKAQHWPKTPADPLRTKLLEEIKPLINRLIETGQGLEKAARADLADRLEATYDRIGWADPGGDRRRRERQELKRRQQLDALRQGG
ncbi:MAG: type III-B CRISPR module RAMP protein Cmr1 [Chromatiaceae bacterium]|jgi:CRISPR-associated protein Cmr1|nr:type III-B CRISPR module RAMP protein Cmr1 [Candidatus Thioaporhodococcus sediminis]